MYTVREMIEDIKDMYIEYSQKHNDKNYAFSRLWDEYYDEKPDEEMVVFNVIIAKLALEENMTAYNDKKCISRVMSDYERMKDKAQSYYKDDITLLNDLVDEIYSQKDIWML